jgi:hypothetical protein
MCLATYFASLPWLGRTSDENEYWKTIPRKYRPGSGLDDATVVPRLTSVVERRQVDPAEVRPESRAPDDVGDVEHTLVLQHR